MHIDSMFNPPTIQSSNPCWGNSDPIGDFGDTPDTEELILQPQFQKQLLKGDVPYRCQDCGYVFLMERATIDFYIKERSKYLIKEDLSPPKGLMCKKAYYTLDIYSRPIPTMVVNTAIVAPIPPFPKDK